MLSGGAALTLVKADAGLLHDMVSPTGLEMLAEPIAAVVYLS